MSDVTNVSFFRSVGRENYRIRFDLDHIQGEVKRFVIQLEHTGQRIKPVVRFDHDPPVHDVKNEGLHLDIFDQRGVKVDVKSDFPDIPLKDCPRWCILYIESKIDALIRRFEYGN